jgi:hypothetical protein
MLDVMFSNVPSVVILNAFILGVVAPLCLVSSQKHHWTCLIKLLATLTLQVDLILTWNNLFGVL